MAQCGVEFTLAVDKWEMGRVEMSMGWEGWGAERAHGIYAPLPLFCCPGCEKWEMEIMSEDAREIKLEEVESKWLKGGTLT